MLANISPPPISQGYQSTRGIDPRSNGEPSLTSLATKLNVQRYRHITNNAIDISPITLSAYGKQQKCDMANNDIGIWQTTISAYDKQRQRDITNNDSVISQTTVLAYAPCRIKRHQHTVLCFCAHKGLLQMRRNSNIRL
jgi:hypothetical protein